MEAKTGQEASHFLTQLLLTTVVVSKQRRSVPLLVMTSDLFLQPCHIAQSKPENSASFTL